MGQNGLKSDRAELIAVLPVQPGVSYAFLSSFYNPNQSFLAKLVTEPTYFQFKFAPFWLSLKVEVPGLRVI